MNKVTNNLVLELHVPNFSKVQEFYSVFGFRELWHDPKAGNESDMGCLVITRVEEYIKKSKHYEKGANLPKGIVPASTFWLVDRGIFLGRVSIRHKLNKKLRAFDGHIGYAIRPSKHNKGYGSKILELAPKEVKKLNSGNVLKLEKDE